MKKAFNAFFLLVLLLGMAACQADSSVIEDDALSVNPLITPSPTSTPVPTSEPTPSPSTSPIPTPAPAATSISTPALAPSAPSDISASPDNDDVVLPDVSDLQFPDLADLEFWFGSGVGAWSTTVKISPDGTFKGYYHDSNMGDDGEGYPNGTMYECSFSGKFSPLVKTGDYEYSMKCESLVIDGTVDEERIIDGVKIITTGPYGFDDADKFSLYLPGKKVSELPEQFLNWVSMPWVLDFENIDVLDFYGLYNVGGEQGFSA